MQLSEFILNCSTEFNGHKQMTISEVPESSFLNKLCKELEAQVPSHKFVVKGYSDRHASIYQKNFWKQGEHHLGHKDRLICSFGD